MTEDLHAGPGPAAAAPANETPAAAPPAGTRSWFKRHRGWAAIGAACAVTLALAISSRLAPTGDDVLLSVHNSGPGGAKAVSEILGRHGVDVNAVGSFGAALDALQASPDATLLLFDRNGFLDASQLDLLRTETMRVVLVTPRINTLTALDAGISQAGVVPLTSPTLEPDCWNDDAEIAGTVSGESGFLYDGDSLCYRPPGTAAGLLASTEDGTLTVLGSAGLVSNEHLAEHGHAALALRMLGSSKDLVWYLPGLGDLTSTDSTKTLDELAPGWVSFVGPWLCFVTVLAIVWRGRRLGPLVFEPLPVVVKAVETAEGRARLYHDSHAVDRARDNLRAGTLVRLAKELRLGPDATADDVAEAAARHLARPVADIKELVHEHPRNEARLVEWSQELDKLENEVRTR